LEKGIHKSESGGKREKGQIVTKYENSDVKKFKIYTLETGKQAHASLFSPFFYFHMNVTNCNLIVFGI